VGGLKKKSVQEQLKHRRAAMFSRSGKPRKNWPSRKLMPKQTVVIV